MMSIIAWAMGPVGRWMMGGLAIVAIVLGVHWWWNSTLAAAREEGRAACEMAHQLASAEAETEARKAIAARQAEAHDAAVEAEAQRQQADSDELHLAEDLKARIVIESPVAASCVVDAATAASLNKIRNTR